MTAPSGGRRWRDAAAAAVGGYALPVA